MKIENTIKKNNHFKSATGRIGRRLAKELAPTFGASDLSRSRC